MQLLKGIVIAMGLAIAIGIGVLVYVIVVRSGEMIEDADPAGEARLPSFAARNLGLPAGSRVDKMLVAGERLILTVLVPDAGQRIVVIDLATGQELGAIRLEAGP
ncbi:MAG: hypothetical protein O7A65_08460 [Proteobacteria bacterium]|nr:hypothetical protein [Pseudomonadota bacterium]